MIRSVDGRSAISIDEVEDVALPLYQGVMIHQFDFSRKGWVSGTGFKAIWREISSAQKLVEPQFLIGLSSYVESSKNSRGLRTTFRDIARSTDERTFISALLPNYPCSNCERHAENLKRLLGHRESRIENRQRDCKINCVKGQKLRSNELRND